MSHSNEFWNFGNADRSEDTPKGYFKPLFPHNLGRPLHHPEQDYNAHLISQIIKGYRVIGSGTHGEMTTADLELGIKLHEVNPGDGTPGSADADYAHYIEAGAKDYEWIWVPAEMGGITSSPLSVSGTAVDKNDCQNQIATINAVASGGTPQYEFSLQASSGLSFGNISNWSTSNVFTQFNGSNLNPGTTYYIYCKDTVGGNIISSGITPNELVAHSTSIIVDNNVTQPGGDDGQVTISITGGIGPFDYDLYRGSDPSDLSTAVLIESANGTQSTTLTFPINATGTGTVSLNAGSYFAIVTDSTTLCQISDGPVSITEPQSLSISTLPLNADCAGGTHLLVINNVVGGTPPYQYSVTDPSTDGYTWGNDNNFNIPAGNNTAYPAVQDSTGFIVDGPIHAFQDPAPYSFALSANNSDCSDQNGSIVFSALQGGPSPTVTGYELPALWQFSVDGGNSFSATWTEVNPGDQYTYNGLNSGSYECVVRRVHSSGVEACGSPVQNIAIAQSPDITATITSTDDIVCGNAGSGTIDISGILAGGQNLNLDYTLTWSFGGNQIGSEVLSVDNYVITELDAGTYIVVLTNNDSSQCQFTQIITIDDATSTVQLTIDDSSDPSCNGETDGYVDLSVTNGTAPYTYSYNTGGNDIILEAGSPNNTWSEIGSFGADDYEFTVVDGNGCSDSVIITLTDPAIVNATITKDADAGCFGQSNGQLTANGTGGNGTYTYLWSNGETTQTISNLAVGDYDVVITDSNGCASALVTESIIEFNNTTITLDSQTNISCNGSSDGSAQITVTGDAPFTYTWIDVATNNIVSTDQNPTGLHAAEYIVTATSNAGCATSSSAEGWTLTITEPTAISNSASTVDESIAGQNDGSATITVGGGTLEYSVSANGVTINGTAGQTDFTFNNLAPATYSYTIVDGNGCPGGGNFTIAPGGSGVTIDSLSQANIPCHGGETTVSVVVSGGSTNYEFSEDGTNWIGVIVGATTPYTFTFPTLVGSGTYTYYVKDTDTSAIEDQEIIVTDLAVPNGTITITDETVAGADDGIIEVTNLTGGTGTYVSVELFDSNDNSVELINAPGPYTFTDLPDGTYTVEIKDDQGCSGSVGAQVQVGGAQLSASVAAVDNPILCYGGTTDVTMTLTGGTGTFRFSNDNGVNWTNYITTNTYTWNNVSATNTTTWPIGVPYMVEDQDTSAPASQQTHYLIVTENPAISVTPTTQNESIVGQEDGSATIDVSGGSGQYDVQVNDANGNGQLFNGTPGQTQFVFTGLAPGAYTILGADSNNCPISGSFTIAQGSPQVSIVSLLGTDPDCHGGPGQIDMVVTGGSGDYQYSVNPSSTNTSGSYDSTTQLTTESWQAGAGTWWLFVKDAVTGDEVGQSVSISQPAPMWSSFNGGETYPGANDASLEVFITGGTAPYSISCTETGETLTGLPSSSGPTPSGTFTTITSAGTYNFVITDANNCPYSPQTTVGTVYTNIAINNVIDDTVCYGETDGRIEVYPSGGSGNYEFSIDGGINYSAANYGTYGYGLFLQLAPDNYNVWLRDSWTGEELEWSSNPVVVSEALEIQVLQSRMTDGLCNAYPEYYIKFSGSNLTSNIAANQSVVLEWSLGNNGGANNTTADITNITSLGNNEFEGSIGFQWSFLTSVNNNGTFSVKITSDGCEKIHGPVSYSTPEDIVLNTNLVSEPACHTDGWVYAVTATGGPSNSYDLNSSPGGNVLSNWDGSQTNVTLPHSVGGNTALIAQHTNYAVNGCASNTVTVDVRKIFEMDAQGSVYTPQCYSTTDGSTISFTITGGLSQFNDNNYRYKLSDDNGSSFGAEQTYTGAVNNMSIGNGTYVIKAYRIVNGVSTEGVCDVTSTIGTVVNPNPIMGDIVSTTQPTQCGETGSITMSISGGNGTYQFSSDGGTNYETLVADGNGNYTFNLLAGTYTVVGRDTAGCEAFSLTRVLTAPASPQYDYTVYNGCWRFAENEHLEMDVFMVDTTRQGQGLYEFTCTNADTPVNYDGKFTFNNFNQGALGNLSTHVPQAVTVKDTETLCEITISANQHGFVSTGPVTSTGAITNQDNSPTAGDVNDFRVTNISGGLGHPYQIELYDSSGNQYGNTLVVSSGTTSGWINDLPSGDYTYKIYDSTTNGQQCGREYDTPMTATTTQLNEETFYHFHMGINVYPFTDLMTAGPAYIIGDTTYTQYDISIQSNFDLIMSDLIDNSDGTNSTCLPGTFEFSGPIDGQQGCNPTWTHNVTGGADFYYLAVPNNSLFNVNLVTAGFLQFNCTGTYNASSRKAFTYSGNGESYWLYKMQNASSTAAKTFGIK